MSYRSYRTYILICLAGAVLVCGCRATTRYEVLSFVFDGVPQPVNGSDGTADSDNKPSTAKVQRRHSKHGPYGAKMCNACHQKGTNTLLLKKEELCFKCHSFQPAKKQHGPLASGGCTVCHDPHRSSYEYLLVAEDREFCTYCHDPNDVYSRDVHQGIDSACTVCHNPHGSDNDFLLR